MGAIHPSIKSLIDMGRMHMPKCDEYRNRHAWLSADPTFGYPYAVRVGTSLVGIAHCGYCDTIRSEHFDYKGLLPRRSPTYVRYWTPSDWRQFISNVEDAYDYVQQGRKAPAPVVVVADKEEEA